MKKILSFTLLEVIIVLVVVSVFAAIAFPRIQKVIRRTKEREIILHLFSIHAANKVQQVRAGEYWQGPANNAQEINLGLGLNISDDDSVQYSYLRTDAQSYTATVRYFEGGNQIFSVQMNESPLTVTLAQGIQDSSTSRESFLSVGGFLFKTVDIVGDAYAVVAPPTPPPTNPCCLEGGCQTLNMCAG